MYYITVKTIESCSHLIQLLQLAIFSRAYTFLQTKKVKYAKKIRQNKAKGKQKPLFNSLFIII